MVQDDFSTDASDYAYAFFGQAADRAALDVEKTGTQDGLHLWQPGQDALAEYVRAVLAP